MKSTATNVGILLAAVIKVIALVFMAFMTFAFLASTDTRVGGPDPSWVAFCTCLSLGLTVLFFLRERIDDERVHSLKLKALSLGFAVAYPLSMWLESGLKRGFKHPITAYEFIIITMVIALGLFHFWRWRDGRTSERGNRRGENTQTGPGRGNH